MRLPPTIFLTSLLVLSPCAQTLVFPPYGHSYGIRKASPKNLFMFFGPLTTFDDPQGLATCKMRSRDDLTTSNDDDEVVVYGVNSGRHQLIYNTSMWTLALYGRKGSGKDQFLSPKGITTEPGGHVYVADWGNNRIVHLYNPRREVRWVSAFNGKSATDPGLSRPMQVALTADGQVYVTDTGNRRIVRFDSTGNVLQIIPSAGEPIFEDGPTTIAVADGREQWSYYRRDRVLFCADRNGRRLHKIGFDGILLSSADLPGSLSAAYGATDYYHNLWITDTKSHRILKYDRDLKLLDIFGSYGTGDDQFVEPRGIAIWNRYGQTFIAEKTGAQYYWLGTDLKSRQLSHRINDFWQISAEVTEYSYLSLFAASGTDTSWFLRKQWIRPGGTELGFRDVTGKLAGVASSVKVRVEPTYSSYTYYSWTYPIAGTGVEASMVKGKKK